MLAKWQRSEPFWPSLMGELSDNDLSTSLTRFFGSVNDVLNQPDNLSVRNLAIQQGATLSTDIRRLDKRVRDVRTDLDARISGSVSRVNGLLRKIADLNLKIVSFEGGGSSKSEAVGLRDERSQTANELTRLIGCSTIEQPDGALAVFARGDYLVSNGTIRKIGIRYDYDRGMARANLEFVDTQAPIAIDSGELAGQIPEVAALGRAARGHGRRRIASAPRSGCRSMDGSRTGR